MTKADRTYQTKRECKAFIEKKIEKYFVQEESGKVRYGQLKFINNLIVRNIAASTRVRLGKTSFLKFVKANILQDREEVLSFLDCEKNIESFMHSAYGNDILFQHNYREEFSYPPFLLLRRVQAIMENNLVVYLNIISDENEEELMETPKKAAYVDLLYSVALYEIFVKEFLAEIVDVWEKAGEWFADKDRKQILKSMEVWNACTGAREKKLIEAKVQPMIEHYLKNYDRLYFYVYFYVYSFRQLQNLLAVLRIIVLIEFVNYNVTHDGVRERFGNEKAIVKEAEFWQFHVANWFGEDKDFFTLVKRNPNFSGWYRELNKIVAENSLLKEMNSGRSEEYHHFRGCIQEYIKCVEAGSAQKRTKQEEEHLWKIQEELSIPLWNAIDSLENMRSTRK